MGTVVPSLPSGWSSITTAPPEAVPASTTTPDDVPATPVTWAPTARDHRIAPLGEIFVTSPDRAAITFAPASAASATSPAAPPGSVTCQRCAPDGAKLRTTFLPDSDVATATFPGGSTTGW